jgi:hypothetical protein
MGVRILPKLPEFAGVRDGYRLAFDLRSKAFTCHSRVQAARKAMRIRPTRRGRGGVSCELVSENAKFPASREFTGNFIDSGLGGASEAAKKGMKSVSYGPIPYAS